MSDAEISSGAAGVESHVAGQDTADTSVAGAAPTGGALDGAIRPDTPGNGGLNDGGETVADDAAPPEEGLPGDGDSITGGTDAASDTAPTSGS
jgi:hypothetical protein